jgi:hypothetical protein
MRLHRANCCANSNIFTPRSHHTTPQHNTPQHIRTERNRTEHTTPQHNEHNTHTHTHTTHTYTHTYTIILALPRGATAGHFQRYCWHAALRKSMLLPRFYKHYHVFVFLTLANSQSYDSEMLRVADVANTYTYARLYRRRRAHVRSQIITGIANTRRCLGRYVTSETLEHGTRAINILIVKSLGAARQRHGHSIYCTNAYVWYMLDTNYVDIAGHLFYVDTINRHNNSLTSIKQAHLQEFQETSDRRQRLQPWISTYPPSLLTQVRLTRLGLTYLYT